MNIFEPRFTDENAAREHLETLHWPNGPVCPHCESGEGQKRLPAQRGRKTKAHPEGKLRHGVVQCNSCRKQYTVTVGTVFESSKVPLNKWLYVNHVLCSSKKGTSAHQIARNIGVTYKTAWFMVHRIREAMKDVDDTPIGGFGKFVEADETYVGGKTKNRNAKQQRRFAEKRRSTFDGKQPVVSLVERDGKARSFHVARVTGETLPTALVTNVDRYSYLMTDEHGGYKAVGKEFGKHNVTNHAKREYVRGSVHTNTVEGFFSILKRGIIGVYHHVSEAHLHRYTTEFDFRYNTRKLDDFTRSDANLLGSIGKRLTYRWTAEGAA